MERAYNPIKYRHKFQDDVWRQIKLNDLERDVIYILLHLRREFAKKLFAGKLLQELKQLTRSKSLPANIDNLYKQVIDDW